MRIASPGQEQIWFFDEMTPGTAVSNIPLLIEVTGPFDPAAARGAIAAVVERHEPLRTAFTFENGRLLAGPAPCPSGEIGEHDLRAVPAAKRQAAARALAMAEAGRPFDLTRGPLWRCSMIRLGPREHLLVLVMHHIATDGYSLLVLRRELVQAYRAVADGRPVEFEPLPRPYHEVTRLQRAERAGERPRGSLEYWKRTLSPPPDPIEWPFAAARPTDPHYGCDVVDLTISDELAAAVRDLAVAEGCSPFMVLTAAFSGLVFRHTGRTDFVVGTPTSGRPVQDADDLVGYFVNMLALRIRCGENPTMRTLLAHVRETSIEAYTHRETPFLDVLHAVQPDRRPGIQPIFQMVFTTPPALGSLDAGGTVFRFEEGHGGQALHDIEIHLPEFSGGRTGFVKFRNELFERAHIEGLAEQYVELLGRAVAGLDLPIGELPLMPAARRHRMLAGWNATEAEYPAGSCLHELVERQVEATPDAVAVVAEGGGLTYRELDERANQVAHRLRELGAGPGTRVGLCMERSAELVTGLLGVLKAGAAYVPLDPAYPPGRLAFMVADAEVRTVLTHDPVRLRVPPGVTALDITTTKPRTDRVAPAAGPDDSAYVIYTSGSTGRPKGVLNNHRGVVNRLVWMLREYGVDGSDVVMQKTPYGFDVSVWEFLLPLIAGARLVMARPGGHRDPAYLHSLIQHERVTMLHFVPSMLQVFLDEVDTGTCTSLRRVICSGEALPAELARRFLATSPPCALHNLYGPTEAAIDVSHWTCEPGERGPVVPIGRPVANTRLYILDGYGEPVPPGMPGELYIGGVQVAAGYVNRPELTAERFVPNPFHEGRLYRTGDLARHRPDGVIEFLGRTDRQIKIRGFRIEPAEIEACLFESGLVKQAAVQMRPDVTGDPELVGYVVLADPTGSLGPVLDHLRAELPPHLVPAALVPLAELPLTVNGKLDVSALPAPDRRPVAGDARRPESAMELRVSEVWHEVLGVAPAGVRDDFFKLGGHSLKVAQATSRLSARLGVAIPLRLLFEQPDLAGFAAAIDGLAVTGEHPVTAPAIVAGARPRGDLGDLLDELDAGVPDADVPNADEGRADVLDVAVALAASDRKHGGDV
ncbi:amino acid adenylation domain-containing protein [Streptosporangium sp. KLBMP 9127]|nr:amino acid adenylation domain-containing protein [Streptosporangium sp. KLBMP 9127]